MTDALIDPIENLTAEHRLAIEALDRLENTLTKNALDAEDVAALGEIVAFFNGELEIHLRKEEKALFPALESFLGRRGGPIGVMLYEHEDLRKTFQLFKNGVDAIRAGTDPAGAAARENGYHIIGVLTNHIHKEDNVLFKMAARTLSENALSEIAEKMKSLEERAVLQNG